MRKKIFVTVLIIFTILVISSCNRKEFTDIGTDTNIQTDEIQTNNQSELNKKDVKFDTVVSGHLEEISIFNLSKDNKKFSEHIYQDDSVDKIITIDVFGAEYELNYVESAIMPRSDMRVNTYRYGDEGFKIYINADTGEIVECIGVPYEYDISNEQQYYMDLIKTLIPAKYSLETYECKVYTHYYEFGEDYMRSQEIEGFKICDENQELVGYRFSFSKKIGNVDVGNYISVEFAYGRLYIELYDFGYDEELVNSYISDFVSVESQFNDHIMSKVKSMYNVINIENKSYTFFMKDGNPYVLVTSEVTFFKDIDPDVTLTELLKTINSFEIAQEQ